MSSVNDFALKGAGIPHAIVMDYLAVSFLVEKEEMEQVTQSTFCCCLLLLQMSLARSEPSRDTDYEVDLIAMSEGRMRLDFCSSSRSLTSCGSPSTSSCCSRSK